MALDIKHPPEHWERLLGIEVMDPDGWRANMLDWEVPITREDFLNRAASSTTRYPKGFFTDMDTSLDTFHALDKRR